MGLTNYNVTELVKDSNYEYLTRPLGDYLMIVGPEIFFLKIPFQTVCLYKQHHCIYIGICIISIYILSKISNFVHFTQFYLEFAQE